MFVSRVRLLLGAAAVVAALAAGGLGAAPAQASVGEVEVGELDWAPCDGRPLTSCLDGTEICTNNIEPQICVGGPIEPIDPNNPCIGHVCLDPGGLDPNNICAGEICITGLGENVLYLVDEAGATAGEAVGIVLGVAGIVTGIAGDAVDDVNAILDEGVCVAPFDPEQPICVKG